MTLRLEVSVLINDKRVRWFWEEAENIDDLLDAAVNHLENMVIEESELH
jgi:hypothetical protein